MVRWLLLSSPAVASAIVAWALLGGTGQARYVEVVGGLSLPGDAVSVLLRASSAEAARSVPLAGLLLRARLRAGGKDLRFEGTTDASGLLEAQFEPGAPLGAERWLEVEAAGSTRPLAAGVLSLGADAWRSGVRRNGGWVPGSTRGAIELSIAPESGVFAVPFASRLRVRARWHGARGETATLVPLAGARVALELSGAELATPDTAAQVTDTFGQTSILLRPVEHAVSLRIVAQHGPSSGEWYGSLPVVPGALVASLQPDGVSVSSPIARERAYLSLVHDNGRIAGAIVPLLPGPDGGANGFLPLSPGQVSRLRAEPAWAVVSSEYDKRSAGVVGWPLNESAHEPPLTFDVPDRVLLDGRAEAIVDARQRRRDHRRRAATALSSLGLAMGGAFLLEVRGRRRRSGPDAAAPGPALAPSRWILGLALLSIALGFGALAGFGLLER